MRRLCVASTTVLVSSRSHRGVLLRFLSTGSSPPSPTSSLAPAPAAPPTSGSATASSENTTIATTTTTTTTEKRVSAPISGDESSFEILRAVLASGKAAAAEKKATGTGGAGGAPSGTLDGTSVSRLLQLLRPEAPRLMGALATLGVTTVISLLFPMAIGRVLDVALDPSGALSPAMISTGLLGLFGVQSGLIVLRSNLITVAGERLSAGIRRDLFKAVLSQDVAWFDRQRTGDVINRLSSDTAALQAALTTQVTGGLRSAFMVAGGAAMSVYLSPSLAALSLVLIPPVALVGITYGRYVEGQQRAVQEALGRTMEVAQELVSNVRTVRQYAREREEAARFDVAVGDSYRLARRIGLLSGYFDGSVHLAANAGLVAVLWYGGNQISGGAMSAGDLTAFLMYSLYTGFNLGNISRVYSELKRASGVAGRIFDIADSVPTIPLAALPPQEYWKSGVGVSSSSSTSSSGGGSSGGIHNPYTHLTNGPPTVIMQRLAQSAAEAAVKSQASSPHPHFSATLRPATVQGAISFRNVHFSYPSRPEHPVLNGLSLDVTPGTSLALVGPSGCGKSTMGALLTRLYDPGIGAVLLDGVDIRNLDPSWLRAMCAVVPQEPALFATSVAANIRYGNPAASDEEIIAAAKLAHAHDFIVKFPSGYNTSVGERGAQLSGGQRQRVAIARAILKNAPILLLDEATSALDSESEASVQEALTNLSAGRTCIIIAHRLSTIKTADMVATLQGGKVFEIGGFSELYNNPTSAFRGFVDKQIM